MLRPFDYAQHDNAIFLTLCTEKTEFREDGIPLVESSTLRVRWLRAAGEAPAATAAGDGGATVSFHFPRLITRLTS